jgi:hypothetical protein
MCTELLPPGGYPIALKYTISYTLSAFLPSFMKTNKRTKKQMVERGVVLCQYEYNAINKLGKKRVHDGSRTNRNTNFHKPK